MPASILDFYLSWMSPIFLLLSAPNALGRQFFFCNRHQIDRSDLHVHSRKPNNTILDRETAILIYSYIAYVRARYERNLDPIKQSFLSFHPFFKVLHFHVFSFFLNAQCAEPCYREWKAYRLLDVFLAVVEKSEPKILKRALRLRRTRYELARERLAIRVPIELEIELVLSTRWFVVPKYVYFVQAGLGLC